MEKEAKGSGSQREWLEKAKREWSDREGREMCGEGEGGEREIHEKVVERCVSEKVAAREVSEGAESRISFFFKF